VLPEDEQIGFWAPMPAAPAFEGPDPARDTRQALLVIGRRRADTNVAQVSAWFDAWARQRFPAGSPLAATRTRVDSLATRIPINRGTILLAPTLTASFGLVLPARVPVNMLLARGLGVSELGVRLSLRRQPLASCDS
jgi:hypothetical protein